MAALSPQVLKLPKVPTPKAVGTFGIKDAITKVAEEKAPLLSPRWAHVLVDIPISAGAMGVGYGVGRLAADAALTQLAHDPKAMKALPQVAGAATGITAMSLAALNSYMRHRRRVRNGEL